MNNRLFALGLVAAFAFILAAPITAGETVSFVDNMYSVTLPDGWSHIEDSGVVNITDGSGGQNMLTIMPPNPSIAGDPAEFAGFIVGTLFGGFGALTVFDEDSLETDGVPSTNALFSLTHPEAGEMIRGVVNVIKYDDLAVVMFAAAGVDQSADFLPAAAGVIDSYHLNRQAVANNMASLEEMGEQLNEVIEQFNPGLVR